MRFRFILPHSKNEMVKFSERMNVELRNSGTQEKAAENKFTNVESIECQY